MGCCDEVVVMSDENMVMRVSLVSDVRHRGTMMG